ncbi:protein kinase [Streptomyces polygonati]|uniref:non-specific serine/threonine protein kinase n=1 Tax=Streptomyces polygonati TaxID=1617087 RepID=A0ABV8HSR2_9ACTN
MPATRAKPTVQGQKPQKAAAPGQKAAPAKAVKAAKTAAAPKVTQPQEPAAPAVAADQPVAPEGGPWRVPGYLHEPDLGASASDRAVRALHEGSGTPVAITYLSPALTGDLAFREAFRGEAGLLGGLDSPYVARLHAYVEDGPHAAIVAEQLDGVALSALLREKGATTPESALAVLKGSLLGLAAVHEAGILHRAYEPANVLVTAKGATKLVGFGLAARGDGSGTPAGSPAYTAPEQLAGGPVTAGSDLYAAAATFYECLTGTPPYAGSAAAEPTVEHAEAPVPDGQVPEPVQPLVARGLAEEPAGRPQTAADFAAEVEAVAVAAYGEDWEERGQRELAASVAPLLLPPPDGGEVAAIPQAAFAASAALPPGGGTGIPAGHGPTGGPEGRERRFGRRAKILAVAVAVVIVAGAVTVTAVATGNKSDADATPTPTPSAVTSLTSAPAAPAPTTTSPSAAPTTASPTASPSASPTATTPPPTRSTPTPSVTPAADVSATATSSPTTTPTAVPTTPSADPTKTTGSATGPHVSSVAVTGISCSTGSHTATATVVVSYDGSAAGTLDLTWWHSSKAGPQGSVTMSSQTARFPKGATSYTYTDKLTFTPDPKHPYIGLTASTDPAAASGNGSYGVGCH